MWESMTREQLRDEAVRQARIANGALADADRLRDAAVRQARIAHDAIIEADHLRATLREVRLLGEQWKRSSDSDTQIMGADLVQILDGDAR